eukprot:4092680-Pyramimonas_sp.AAC.1
MPSSSFDRVVARHDVDIRCTLGLGIEAGVVFTRSVSLDASHLLDVGEPRHALGKAEDAAAPLPDLPPLGRLE